jgi:hypothetical protein
LPPLNTLGHILKENGAQWTARPIKLVRVKGGYSMEKQGAVALGSFEIIDDGAGFKMRFKHGGVTGRLYWQNV